MSIIQIRGDRHVVDNHSVALRNGVKLGHAQALESGDTIITRVPEQWHHGDYDMCTAPERYTVGTFPAVYFNGVCEAISPAYVRTKLAEAGMGDRDIDRFMGIEEEVVLLPPPPPAVVLVTPVEEDDTPYW